MVGWNDAVGSGWPYGIRLYWLGPAHIYSRCAGIYNWDKGMWGLQFHSSRSKSVGVDLFAAAYSVPPGIGHNRSIDELD